MILDTNAVSALAEGAEALPPLLESAGEIALPVIVLGEYRFGISQSRHAARYERWLLGLIADCRVLPVSEETAVRYAEIRLDLKCAGRRLPENDIWIAALALEHALPLVSRDAHFDHVKGLVRFGW